MTRGQANDQQPGLRWKAPMATNTQTSETTPLLHRDSPSEDSLVTWEGEDDPEHPYNWPRWRTLWNCTLISTMTFLTATASAMIAPGVPQLMLEFNSHSPQLAAFVTSVYILGFAAGPLVIAPMSEMHGRVPLYHICNIGFVLSVAACALATNMEGLVILRFISGVFGSCPATIGGGSIADMVPQQRRGAVMAGYTVGALFAPIVGPILGGVLSDALGWRSNFVVLAGLHTIVALLCVTLRETYHPVLLERKVARLRVKTGNKLLQSRIDTGLTPVGYLVRNIARPLKMLTRSPPIIILSLFMALTYGYMYLMFTSFTQVFKDYYGLSTKLIGFAFLGLGLGSFIGVAIFSATSDKQAKKQTDSVDDDDLEEGGSASLSSATIIKPEYRLLPLPWAVLCMAFGLLTYGWTIYFGLHWMVPVLCTVFIGIGQLVLFLAIQMYLVDAFTTYAASAIAAFTVVRSIAGAVLPLCGLQLFDFLGIGWGNTLLAAVCLPLIPTAVLMIKYGESLRENYSLKDL